MSTMELEDNSYLSFHLSPEFIAKYAEKDVAWGMKDAGGTSFSEIVFLRTYSRKKSNGQKEKWFEVCRRVVEGTYSIQKDWAKAHVLPWSDFKAQKSAQEMYDRMFRFLFTPPGRGLASMGTELVNGKNGISSPLQNCSMWSTGDMTKNDVATPFCNILIFSSLGVGCGFDTDGAKKDFQIYTPSEPVQTFVVPDSREGWAEALKLKLESYLMPKKSAVAYDYSEVRPYGAEIKTLGGTASGPEALMKLLQGVDSIFNERSDKLNSVDIVDIVNMIGVCIVSGGTRRSALIALGEIEDKNFLSLKDASVFPERNSYDPENPGWGWASNNSVRVNSDADLSGIIEGIERNGEPGVMWLNTAQDYGRLADAPDYKDAKVKGVNPCSEIFLESFELCTLSELYLERHSSLEDFQRSIKFAYLYAKTVTLLPTHNAKTNSVMQRNRRLGVGVSGISNFVDSNSVRDLNRWLDSGYKTIKEYDRVYSEWLCVRESIKLTCVKPSGSVSSVTASSPGIHWTPGGEYFNRAIRMRIDDPLVEVLRSSGHVIEPADEQPDTTVVVYFPIRSLARRSEKDVSIFEKVALAATAQKWWADNGVSVTVSFDPKTEAKHISTVLSMYEGQLKSVSFLPMNSGSYAQMPFTQISAEDYDKASLSLVESNLSVLYQGTSGIDAEGESGCVNDTCELPKR